VRDAAGALFGERLEMRLIRLRHDLP
jgi:hypothetical protein